MLKQSFCSSHESRADLLVCFSVVFFSDRQTGAAQVFPPLTNDASLHLPLAGQNELHILSVESAGTEIIHDESLAAGVSRWNFVSAPGLSQFPGASEFVVSVDGQTVPISAVGFKRRPFYAPLAQLRFADRKRFVSATRGRRLPTIKP